MSQRNLIIAAVVVVILIVGYFVLLPGEEVMPTEQGTESSG